eukprot:318168-Pleurochrysis_carterae.AAC.1
MEYSRTASIVLLRRHLGHLCGARQVRTDAAYLSDAGRQRHAVAPWQCGHHYRRFQRLKRVSTQPRIMRLYHLATNNKASLLRIAKNSVQGGMAAAAAAATVATVASSLAAVTERAVAAAYGGGGGDSAATAKVKIVAVAAELKKNPATAL